MKYETLMTTTSTNLYNTL